MSSLQRYRCLMLSRRATVVKVNKMKEKRNLLQFDFRLMMLINFYFFMNMIMSDFL